MSTLLAEGSYRGGQTVQIVRSDITLEKVDAIVNAANAQLQHGGGVAGAILQRGGAIIQQESDAWIRVHGLVPHARPAWTSGGALPARYVIHAVGPVWGEGDEEAKLAAAVAGCLRVAGELGCTSIAIPAISTGIFGFPIDLAAKIILETIENYFNASQSSLKLIKLVLYDSDNVALFLKAWRRMQDEPELT